MCPIPPGITEVEEMSRKDRIEKILRKHLSVTHLEVLDDSGRHANHAGNPGGKETHLKLVIEAEELKNLSPVQRHRVIHKLLKEEFETGLHALSIST